MKAINPSNPLIVNSETNLLLETDNPLYSEVRDQLARFAELEKAEGYMHTYKLTPLSLWNAVAAGIQPEEIRDILSRYSKYPVPEGAMIFVREQAGRYGKLTLQREGKDLVLRAADRVLATLVSRTRQAKQYLVEKLDDMSWRIDENHRGLLKQALIKVGFPVADLAGYLEGDKLDIELRDTTLSGRPFRLRDYQREAAEVFHAAGGPTGGSGVLILPCGAGKTIISLAVMSRVSQRTLILTTNITALRQLKAEILDKTHLTEDQVGEYSGEAKEIRPVTLTTYQLLTFRKKKDEDFVHMGLFNAQNWGLIIYDEVHMLPAPVFRSVADLQARRRLGLTATLIREDGLEDEVFSLIGPKKYDVPWKKLEGEGWIATARCIEVSVPLSREVKAAYDSAADQNEQYRIASENPVKNQMIHSLLERHRDANVLIIGGYLSQLDSLSREFNAPIITGKTPNKEREEIYARFKSKEIRLLIVSKVANFAIDLPDANVAIQVSGTWGSRQEEAQRLGRVLRPKGSGLENIAHYYSIVTRDPLGLEQKFSTNRRRFLMEQGYDYRFEIVEDEDAEATAGAR